jgi:hypothetical protein
MKKLAIMCAAACAATLGVGVATASAADTVNYSFAGQTSADSGTCGNDWANDTFTRVFKVYPEQNTDGSYRLVENFTKGKFVTVQGQSPEACGVVATEDTVSANVKGTMKGNESLKVVNGTYSASGAASWDGTGGTAGFVTAAFGASATGNVVDYWFKYHTPNAAACANTWVNAATGDAGDIATVC